MAKFLKHIGKHGDRKVAVIFRQIPGEEHMCLVIYTETLNQNIHDPMMAAIESDSGQQSENLGDALNRAFTRDGKIILQVLHREGMLKKVQTNQVVMTPVPNQTIRLSELNDILNEMAKGEDAVKRLAEMDASRGLQDPKDVAKRKAASTASAQTATQSPAQGMLDNSDLANNLRLQAQRMANEARGLLAESERLLKEAASMEPPVQKEAPAKKTRKAKVVEVAQVVEAAPAKKTRASSKTAQAAATAPAKTAAKKTTRSKKAAVAE